MHFSWPTCPTCYYIYCCFPIYNENPWINFLCYCLQLFCSPWSPVQLSFRSLLLFSWHCSYQNYWNQGWLPGCWMQQSIAWASFQGVDHFFLINMGSLVAQIGKTYVWSPTPVFLLEDFHWQRSLVGYNLWSHKESDMTEWLTLFTLFSLIYSFLLGLQDCLGFLSEMDWFFSILSFPFLH